jgi:hypothetical protein
MQQEATSVPVTGERPSTGTRGLLGSLREAPDDNEAESSDDSAWEPLSEDECDVSSVEAYDAAHVDNCASSEESSPDESVFS